MAHKAPLSPEALWAVSGCWGKGCHFLQWWKPLLTHPCSCKQSLTYSCASHCNLIQWVIRKEEGERTCWEEKRFQWEGRSLRGRSMRQKPPKPSISMKLSKSEKLKRPICIYTYICMHVYMKNTFLCFSYIYIFRKSIIKIIRMNLDFYFHVPSLSVQN